eukprot:scaffold94515_cov27-Phaeocystis_antarctica.AAC.1
MDDMPVFDLPKSSPHPSPSPEPEPDRNPHPHPHQVKMSWETRDVRGAQPKPRYWHTAELLEGKL